MKRRYIDVEEIDIDNFRIGTSTDVWKTMNVTTFTYDPPEIGPNNKSDTKAVSVTGAAVGDFVIVAPGVDVQDTVVSGSVVDSGTVEVVIYNDVTSVDLASSTWKILLLQTK
jgi:hypothetical protein